MSPAVRKYFLCAILSALVGLVLFFIAAAPPSENAPKGPLETGAGPMPYANINKTEVFVDVPGNSVDARVTFRFNEIKKYFIYAMFPYSISNATPYAIYNSGFYSNSRSNIGVFSSNFLNAVGGSSIVNATLDLNATFPFFFVEPDLRDELTLCVTVKFQSSLAAINYPLGTSQTVILTFFGDPSGVFSRDMDSFKRPSSQLTVDQPFIVHLKIPSDTYYSASQPSPIGYYIKEDYRFVMFSMDFLGGRHAQTLFCSFANPTMQAVKEIFIFVGGIFVAISGSFAVEIVRHHVEGEKTRSPRKREKLEPDDSSKGQTSDVQGVIKLSENRSDRKEELRGLFVLGLLAVMVAIKLQHEKDGIKISFGQGSFNLIPILDITILLWSLYAFFMVIGLSDDIIGRTFSSAFAVLARTFLLYALSCWQDYLCSWATFSIRIDCFGHCFSFLCSL